MAEVMIEGNNLTKFYGDHLAVDDISIEVKKGEVVGFLGPNGSGKSTLASIIAGRDGFDVVSGSVDYDGQDLLELPPEERARQGIFLAPVLNRFHAVGVKVTLRFLVATPIAEFIDTADQYGGPASKRTAHVGRQVSE